MQILLNNFGINFDLVQSYSIVVKNNNQTGMAEYGVQFIFTDKAAIKVAFKTREECESFLGKIQKAVLEEKKVLDLTSSKQN